MARILFDTEALTRVRFAISPTIEMVASVRALQDPGRWAIHMPWIARARGEVADLDLSALHALQGSGSYNPDFIHPLPTGPLASFEEELATMLATPEQQVRTEVLGAYEDAPLPAVLEPFVEDPGQALADLAQLMRTYWGRVLAPEWERVRALLEHDILYRARQMADGGVHALFADLDPTVSWRDGVLTVTKSADSGCKMWDCELALDERGLLLVPSAFAWPKVLMVAAEPWQPTLIYPARGVGMLWDGEATAPPDALAKLLGRGRAAVLLALESPRSTLELAGLLGVTSGGISQQLSVLAGAGLVSRKRVSRNVLYLRTTDGDALVQAAGEAA